MLRACCGRNRKNEAMHKTILMALFGFMTAGTTLPAQETTSLQALVHETQRMEQHEDHIRLVWWIPTEYWKKTLGSSSGLTEAQKDAYYGVVDDYIVVCVIDTEVSEFGSLKPTSRDELLKRLSLTIEQGEGTKPLADSELSGEGSNIK